VEFPTRFGGGRLRGGGGILLDGFHAGLITLAGWRTIVSRAASALLFPGLAFKDKASAFNRRECRTIINESQ